MTLNLPPPPPPIAPPLALHEYFYGADFIISFQPSGWTWHHLDDERIGGQCTSRLLCESEIDALEQADER